MKDTDTWLNIDSAPRDGTAVLACGSYQEIDGIGVVGNTPRTVVWKVYHRNAPGKGAWRNHLGHKEEYLTHWMPLPKCPGGTP